MPLNQEEIKRRIQAARLLRGVSQKDLNRMGADDGFGNEEMGRVERGELEFRPGKHLDPLCRYLRVPRWWFIAEDLEFGGIDAPPSSDELAALVAQQNLLLQDQTLVLEAIKAAVANQKRFTDELDEHLLQLGLAVVDGQPQEDESERPPEPAPTGAAGKKKEARSRTP